MEEDYSLSVEESIRNLNIIAEIKRNKPIKIREIEEVFIAVGNERGNLLLKINHKGIEQFSDEELENIFFNLMGHHKRINRLWQEYDVYLSKNHPQEAFYKNLHPDYEKARTYGMDIIRIVNNERTSREKYNHGFDENSEFQGGFE